MKNNAPISFFEKPILNSPYEAPRKRWELDERGQPTDRILPGRREVAFVTPVPKPRRRGTSQDEMIYEEIGDGDQQYQKLAHVVNGLRRQLAEWRDLPQAKWQVTSQTARLLEHWRGRNHKFQGVRPFFCQVEAAETAIWLTEVAPKIKVGRQFLEHLQAANDGANPGLPRLALKMATGAGKTTVMAMIIAWQTVNAVRRPTSPRFTRGFLIVTPGITIKDRLRVLLPNDPDNYYKERELVPGDMLGDVARAKIIITNYHAFMLREKMDLSQGGRALMQGRKAPELETKETEGQMIRRVMPELTGMKNILAFNDEGHHCYRRKPGGDDEGKLTGDARKEAEKNQEAARVWISGLESVRRKLGLNRIFDLSATPFFLRGSSYAEGTLFPWTMSDFALMDAIECGIVKLLRVPVADNVPSAEMPQYRALWENIRGDMPKKGRDKASALDPSKLPKKLETALAALYGHYEKVFDQWQQAANVEVPPCFIVVCNNTSTSKLVYDYIAGFQRKQKDGSATLINGRLKLFQNFDNHGNPLARPRTLLIDSEQLESGEALDKNFRTMAADEIERFRQEIRVRTGNRRQAENLSDQDLLREVMNTVGKPGTLGASIRCVVSVSMLPKAGTPTPLPTSSASAPSARNSSASKLSVAPCAANPTT